MAAEAEQGGERTEEPSQKRLQDARERGQVPRSRELTNFATMIGGSAMLVAVGGSLATHLSQMVRHGLVIDPQNLRDTGSMLSALGEACTSAFTALLPVFGALIGLTAGAAVSRSRSISSIERPLVSMPISQNAKAPTSHHAAK